MALRSRVKNCAIGLALGFCFQATNGVAQQPPNFFGLFGGIMNAAIIDNARREWQNRPLGEYACLRAHGLTAETLALRGVAPLDPRVRHMMYECADQPATSPQPVPLKSVDEPKPLFVVDGVGLGSLFRPEMDSNHTYACEPSEQFAGFTWCRRGSTEPGKFGPHFSSVSVLRSNADKVVYVSQSISPAFFT